ncbi:hypothetical protein JNK13_08435 [bacterium]|nr:hypothetical protein [bacterium]
MKNNAFNLALILCLSFSACTTKQASTGQNQLANSTTITDPLSYEVLDSKLTPQGLLSVTGSITAKTDWPTNNAVLELSTFVNGERKASKYVYLDQALGKEMLKRNSKDILALSIESMGATDYQMRLLWGAETKQFAKNNTNEISDQSQAKIETTKPQSSAANTTDQGSAPQTATKEELKEKLDALALVELETISNTIACSVPPCDLELVVSGKIYNPTATTIKDPKLALGLAYAPDGRPTPTAADPSTEEIVELSGVTIDSGQKRVIKLTVDRPVPQIPGGKFVPVLRIVTE